MSQCSRSLKRPNREECGTRDPATAWPRLVRAPVLREKKPCPKPQNVCTIGPSSREEPVLREMIRGHERGADQFPRMANTKNMGAISHCWRWPAKRTACGGSLQTCRDPSFRIGPIEMGRPVGKRQNDHPDFTGGAGPTPRGHLPHAELMPV